MMLSFMFLVFKYLLEEEEEEEAEGNEGIEVPEDAIGE